MAAMAWPRARPNVLHPRQYGGINLERAYYVLGFKNALSFVFILVMHHKALRK